MEPNRVAALECNHLRKQFPGIVALDDVSLRVEAGELHALVGENGAGKSTLVKIIAGQLAPDGGQVLLGGEPVAQFSPRAARQFGVAMVPQYPDLFNSLTALENLFVGEWPLRLPGLVSWREMRSQGRGVLERMGVSLDLDAPAGALTVAQRQLLQIARALLADARLLILDEPTAPLGQDDAERLFRLIRHLHGQGVSVIYISHRLAEVFELAQRVTVLRDGRLVATLPIEEVTRDRLIGMMIGEEGDGQGSMVARQRPAIASQRSLANGQRATLMSGRELSVHGKLEGVSLQLQAGEIVGLAGVAGSGRNELLRALAGVEHPKHGVIEVQGAEVRQATPGLMRERGVAFVPADRHQEALVLPMSIRENVTLGRLKTFSNALGLVRRGQEAGAAQELVTRFAVRASGIEQAVASLSGGNQQKVALASRLLGEARVLLLEEPTQGVDVGARAEIHRLLRRLAAQGAGIVLLSSDLPELLELSDRVLVMHRGRLVGELPGSRATQEAVLDLALGTTEAGVAAQGVVSRRRPLREVGLAALLCLLTVAVSVLAPGFATGQNLLDILVNNSHLLIAATGMTLVIIAGGIDISVGSMLAVCATLAGAGAAVGWHPAGVLAVALGVGVALGAVNAGLISGARIPPIIATLATLTLFRHVLIHFTGGRWINMPPSFREFGLSAPLHVPVPVWIAAGTALVVGLLARWLPLGRAIYAVGNNPQAAEHVGLSVRRVQAATFLVAGLLVGLAAFAFACRYSAIQTNAGQGFEMLVITAVVVGGTNVFGGSGSILGTVIGVLLLGVISGSLTPLHIDPTWERACQGALILGAVVVDTVRGRGAGEG